MGKYIIRRVISMLLLLVAISFLVFMFIHLIPGDPVRLIAGMDATKQEVDAIRTQLGLDKPLLVQYSEYMKGLLSGDLGYSVKNHASVSATIGPRFKPTIILTACAMLWATFLGIFLGIIAAIRRGKPLDYISMIIAISGISIPSFWLGLMLIQFFSVRLGMFPTGGLETARSYVLPAVCMGCGIMAVLARFTRSSMLENLKEDYVRTARAKGMSEPAVIVKYALRNSLIEVVTIAGLQIGGLLSGSVMVETVFSIPGLGRLLVDSINFRDYKVVQALLMFFAIEYIIINFVVDIIYGFLNPKVRYQ